MTKKPAKKTKAKKQAQTKIPGTERIDADTAFEEQAEKVRKLTNKRTEVLAEEIEERAKLTEMHRAKGGEIYTYEDEDGELRDIVLPEKDEPTSKVRKHKSKQDDAE